MDEQRNYVQPLKVGLFAVEPIRRAGLHGILEEISGLQLIDFDMDGTFAGEPLDVVVISLMVPAEMLEAIERLRQNMPLARVIVMSEDGDEESVIAAISAGAKGYLQDNATAQDVERAVAVVASGSIWAPRRTLSILVDRMLEHGPLTARSAPQFTHREREVLQLLVSARSNREIAAALGIEVRTVKSYIGRMMRKVGVGNRIALSIHATRHALGTVPGDDS